MSDDAIEFHEGDLFRWSWKRPRSRDPYWACARIAEFHNGLLRDIYWSDYRRLEGAFHGKRWSPERANECLELTFLANIDDLEPRGEIAFREYDPRDIVDLRHPNNRSSDRVFVRKGAEKNADVIREALVADVATAESEVRLAEGNLRWARGKAGRVR